MARKEQPTGAARYEALLFITAAIWGTGFVAQRLGMVSLGPFSYNAARFMLGSTILVPVLVARRASQAAFKAALGPGMMAGTILAAAASLQQAGLQYTSAGKAGFITGLYVVLVPVAAMVLGRRTPMRTWLGAAFAFGGLYALSFSSIAGVNSGDLLVLASSVFWTAHILALDRWASRVEPLMLACIQFAVCSSWCWLGALAFESPSIADFTAGAVPIAYGGVLSIGVAYTLQAVAQSKAHPARAAIIMALESPFAAVSGALLLGERMSPGETAGCALMLAGTFVAQWPARKAASLRLASGPGSLYRVGMETTIPLLHDNHNHVALYAAFASCLDISSLPPDEALSTLRALPSGTLSVVRGWKSFELPMGRETLSSLPPVLLINFSLHGFVVSDSAIPYLERVVPEVAARRDDQAWCEANVPAIFGAYCGLAGLDEDKLVSYIDAMVRLGIGSTDEMTVPTLEALDACLASRYADRLRLWVSPALYRKLDKSRRGRVMGVKLYLDGAIGARSAAIVGPWMGSGKAMFTYRDDELVAVLEEIASYGTGVSMHAIGELAIAQAIGSLERLGPSAWPLVRLEHLQFIDRAMADRAKKLGATLSMQPNFTSDSRDYADRLAGAYLKGNNPFRMLIDDAGFVPGADLLFGSDGMPDGIAYAATQALFPPFPSQRLSLEELVAGYGEAIGIAGFARLRIDEEARRVTVLEARQGSSSPKTMAVNR